MTEREMKELCKFAAEHSNYNFTPEEKEALKFTIDHAETAKEVIAAIFTLILKVKRR